MKRGRAFRRRYGRSTASGKWRVWLDTRVGPQAMHPGRAYHADIVASTREEALALARQSPYWTGEIEQLDAHGRRMRP